ncbi:unnamed protein product [Rhodiola kirilowii]
MSGLSETEAPAAPTITISSEWKEQAEEIAYGSVTAPVVVVCGAKNCGKTTFSRHLLNVLLQRYRKVAYLDTDVGQSEFTPPGCLSLTVIDNLPSDLAIPCMKTPERCYFFGDTSSKRDPKAYLNCIFALYDYYSSEYRTPNERNRTLKNGLPLVVNTPGWVKGIGYDILVNMIQHMAPTHVVKINISAGNKNLPGGKFWLNGYYTMALTDAVKMKFLDEIENQSDESVELTEIDSARKDSSNRSILVQKDASLLRDLKIMAYFRQIFPSNMSITTIKELAQALTSHPPYQVPVSAVKIKHLYCQIPASEVFYSLNASIVGLAISSEDSETSPHCVGLGIVRSIDTIKQLLYVLTPLPPSMVGKVDLLLQGFIQIPKCLLQVDGRVSPYMPANVVPSTF